ncbi:MAG TPA: deoxyribose-phosphate aldolase [Bacillota bacterium]|nr:deoxyribose-phosphate aldolase [Bacillota bacterium]
MKLEKYIDHTILNPDAKKADIHNILSEAKEYGFASVCVNPSWVAYCSKELAGTQVKVCTVIGFPLGSTTTETKVFEAKEAIKNGAEEIDLVINISALKDRDESYVKKDIQSIVKAAGQNIITKVIIETALLSDEEKVLACTLAKEAGADFVKTSTGFSSGGATEEDIRLMRKTVGKEMGVKASGGIRDKETAVKMIEAGATRIGASAGVSIVNE